MLRSRKIEIINRINETKWCTNNKTIMDHAIEYSDKLEAIEAINHVRMHKKITLPCELVGFLGGKQTKELRDWKAPSTIMQKVKFDEVIRPHKRLVEEWEKFVQWLETKDVNTIIDFDQNVETKYELSADKICLKANNTIAEYCKANE